MTNSEIAQRQAEIDARLAAATPGEWKRRLLPSDGGYRVYNPDGDMFWFDKIEDAEFIANAKSDLEWLGDRVEVLEAENIYATKLAESSVDANFALAKRNIIQYKWARRWKRLAKYLSGLLGEAQGWTTWALKDNSRLERRIAALENAARSCATCVYHLTGNAACLKCNEEYSGWVFNEKQFARKEGANNDDTTKTKI